MYPSINDLIELTRSAYPTIPQYAQSYINSLLTFCEFNTLPTDQNIRLFKKTIASIRSPEELEKIKVTYNLSDQKLRELYNTSADDVIRRHLSYIAETLIPEEHNENQRMIKQLLLWIGDNQEPPHDLDFEQLEALPLNTVLMIFRCTNFHNPDAINSHASLIVEILSRTRFECDDRPKGIPSRDF